MSDSFIVVGPPEGAVYIVKDSVGVGPQAVAAALAAATAAQASEVAADLSADAAADSAEEAAASAAIFTLPRDPATFLRVPASATVDEPPSFGVAGPQDITVPPDAEIPSLKLPLYLPDYIGQHYTTASFVPKDLVATVCTGQADATPYVQSALDELPPLGKTLYVDPGQILRLSPAASGSLYLGVAGSTTSYAVLVQHTNTRIVGLGGKFVWGPTPAPYAAVRRFMFYTPQALAPGALGSVTFDGVHADFAASYSASGTAGIFCFICSVDDLRIQNVTLENSDADGVRGQGLSIWNCRRVQIENYTTKWLQQGMNLGYLNGVEISNCFGSHFTEWCDINYQVDRVVIDGIDLADSSNSQQSQGLDLVGNYIQVSNVNAQNIPGNLMGFYTKNSWPTFREHVENGGAHPPNPVTANYLSISGVRAQDVGLNGYVSIFACLDRSAVGAAFGVSRGIFIDNVQMKNSSGISIREGVGVTLSNIFLDTVRCDSQGAFAGINVSQATSGGVGQTESYLSGVVENVTVINATHTGVQIVGMAEGSVNNVTVSGYGTAPEVGQANPTGVSVSANGIKPGSVRVGRVTVEDTGSTGFNNISITGSAVAVSGDSTMQIDGPFRSVGTAPISVGGTATFLTGVRPYRDIIIPDINTFNPNSTSINGGRARIEVPIYVQTSGQSALRRFFSAKMTSLDGVTVPTNGTLRLSLQKLATDGVTFTELQRWFITTDLAANSEAPVTIPAATGTAGTINAGEQLWLICTRDSTGTYGVGVNGGTFLLQYAVIDVDLG